MTIYSNGKTIEVGGGSGGVTMDQVNTAIDAKLDAYTPLEVYSTEETRIGTWIDGKPLYRKVFKATSPAATNTTSVLVSFPNIIPVNIYGNLIVNDRAGSIVPLNFAEGATSYIFTWYIYNALQMKQNHPTGEFTSKPVHLVVEYTKTTDQATVELSSTLANRRDDALAMDTASLPTAAVTAASVEFESEEV